MRTGKIACITVFIFVVSLIFSGYTFEKKDEIASDYIDVYEYYCLEEAANNILDVKEGDSINIDILYTLDEKSNYVLVSTNYSGYIIFHRASGCIMEMSFYNQSQYNKIRNSVYFYAGPNNHFVKENGFFRNIITNEVIDKSNVNSYVDFIKQQTEDISINSKIKKYSELKKACKEYFNNCSKKSRDVSWSDNPFYSEINGLTVSYIDNYYDGFVLANLNNCFRANSHGSCIFVAYSLLLRFYDLFFNDSIIPDNLYEYEYYNNGNGVLYRDNICIPQTWKSTCSNYFIQDYDDDSIYVSMAIDPEFNIYEALHNYLACLSGISKFGNYGNNAIEAYSNTLPCTDIDFILSNAFNINILNMKLAYLISENIPAYTTMYTHLENNEYSGSHATITYGYVTSNTTNYYVMHMGYIHRSEIIVPQSFLKMTYGYISDVDSIHNVYFGDELNDPIYHYSCNITGCFATLNHNWISQNYLHFCPCGDGDSHTNYDAFNISGIYINDDPDYMGHLVRCVDCDQSKLFKDDSNLTSEDDFPPRDAPIPHKTYSSHMGEYVSNGSTHSRVCSKCNYVISSGGTHIYIFGRCILCGHRK